MGCALFKIDLLTGPSTWKDSGGGTPSAPGAFIKETANPERNAFPACHAAS
jgi:hypothetical protein